MYPQDQVQPLLAKTNIGVQITEVTENVIDLNPGGQKLETASILENRPVWDICITIAITLVTKCDCYADHKCAHTYTQTCLV